MFTNNFNPLTKADASNADLLRISFSGPRPGAPI
jgi:hypothetical protein